MFPLDVVGGDEADEGVDHDQRARGGLAEGQAGDHVLGGKPAVVVDGGVGDERQHRVGAAEGDQRGDGEEAGELADQAAERRRAAATGTSQITRPFRKRPSHADTGVLCGCLVIVLVAAVAGRTTEHGAGSSGRRGSRSRRRGR